MIDTELKANTEHLIRLVKQYATPDTLKLIASEWDAWSWRWMLTLLLSRSTYTWGLILDTLDDSGDCKEYLELSNLNIIKEWHE